MKKKSATTGIFGSRSENPYYIDAQTPFLSKFADKIIYLFDWFFGRVMTCDAEKLILQACKKTGLSDFGDDPFREPLKILCDLSKNGAIMTFLGRIMVKEELQNRLENKLRIESNIKAHPEILKEEIQSPIFILGLPRTGSTFLQRLLSQDPEKNFPMYWEMDCPVPRFQYTPQEMNSKIKKAQRKITLFNYAIPKFKAIHDMTDVRYPEECIMLMANCLISGLYCQLSKDYWDWINRQDLTCAYQFHKKQLQLLQWKSPAKQWILKSPFHLRELESLLKVYPDARIIQTHRNPLDVLPSIASMGSNYTSFFFKEAFSLVSDSDIVKLYKEMVDEGLKMRLKEEARPNSKVIFQDVYYANLVKDPINSAKKIYANFGLKLSHKAIQQMQRYLDKHKQSKHGKHKYTLEQFELNPEHVRKSFQPYCDHFGIPAV